MRVLGDDHHDVELADEELDAISGGIKSARPWATDLRQRAFADSIEARQQAAEHAEAQAQNDYHVDAMESAFAHLPEHMDATPTVGNLFSFKVQGS